MSNETKGQVSRRNIREAVENALPNYCPNEYRRMACLIAYDFNLSPDTVKYRYLDMFIEKGILKNDGNGRLAYVGNIESATNTESATEYMNRKKAEMEEFEKSKFHGETEKRLAEGKEYKDKGRGAEIIEEQNKENFEKSKFHKETEKRLAEGKEYKPPMRENENIKKHEEIEGSNNK
jgi:hypothetical protein